MSNRSTNSIAIKYVNEQNKPQTYTKHGKEGVYNFISFNQSRKNRFKVSERVPPSFRAVLRHVP